MNETQASEASPTELAPLRDRRLRILAIPILALIFAEALFGSSLASEGSSYSPEYLAAHVGVAAVLCALALFSVIYAFLRFGWRTRTAAGLTAVAVVGATLAGTVFYFGGQSGAALNGMESLTGVALIGAILLILWGSAPAKIPATPSA